MLVSISRVMNKTEKIFVAGHRGMVGSALTRALEASGFANLIKRDRSELDLGDSAAVTKFFAKEKPQIVIFAAAKVGGIKANNDQPVEFLLENLSVQNNVIAAAHESGARKLLFLGSSCSGEQARRGANFCTWTIARRLVFTFSRNMTRPKSSMSVAVKTCLFANWRN